MKYLNNSIFTIITIIPNKGVYPVCHVIQMKTGLKLVSSMGMSYGWCKDMKAVFDYYNQK